MAYGLKACSCHLLKDSMNRSDIGGDMGLVGDCFDEDYIFVNFANRHEHMIKTVFRSKELDYGFSK